MRSFPANIGLSFGSPALPDSPVITGVVDDGTEDSVTVTVSGSGTIQLYYRIKYVTAWTVGLSRSGDGDIVQTGLTAGKWYELYITSTIDSIESQPGAVNLIFVVDTDDNTVETALFAILIGDETVDSLVGSRIFPNLVPQKATIPAITYQQISGVRSHDSGGAVQLVEARFQINCWSKSYGEARDIASAVRVSLDGYSGTGAGITIESILLLDEADMLTRPSGAEGLNRYGKRLDFQIWFKE